jgi:hypothetical protein
MKNSFWKTYAVVMGILTAYSYMMAPFSSALIWADFAANIVAFTGLLMFAFQRKFLVKPFWGFCALAFVGWLVYYYGFSSEAVKPDEVIYALINVAIMLPMILALFIYGFGAKAIWQATESDDSQGGGPR